MPDWSETHSRLHTLAMCSVEISEASDGFVLDSVKWARRAELLWLFSRIRMQKIEASLLQQTRSLLFLWVFLLAWAETENTDWQAAWWKGCCGGSSLWESPPSSLLPENHWSYSRASVLGSLRSCLMHPHTRTDVPGSWGRNRDYGRWRASQLELEHSAFALLLSLHNSWCHCSQPLLPTFSGALYFWPPVSLPPATSPCLLPWKLPPSRHHPL